MPGNRSLTNSVSESTPVTVNVYDMVSFFSIYLLLVLAYFQPAASHFCVFFIFQSWLNEYIGNIGLGVYHTGVEVYNREYCYGGHQFGGSGIFEMTPRDTANLGPNYAFKLVSQSYISSRFNYSYLHIFGPRFRLLSPVEHLLSWVSQTSPTGIFAQFLTPWSRIFEVHVIISCGKIATTFPMHLSR